MKIKLFLIALFWVPVLCDSYSILALMVVGTKSHFTVLRPLLEELISRGHNITLLSMCKSNLPGIEEYVLNLEDRMGSFNNPFDDSSKLGMFWKFRDLMKDILREIFEDEVFQQFSQDVSGRQFDVVILSANVNEFLLPIAHKTKAPIVLVSPPILSTPIAWEFNVPIPLSYVPSLFGNHLPPFTFSQRFMNAFVDVILTASYWYISLSDMEEVSREYFQDMPTFKEIKKNVSLLLVNQHLSLQSVKPQMPNVIDIGGIHCRPGDPLPNEFSDFISGTEAHGFIVFSLGSAIDGNLMPAFMLEALLKGFARLKQKIIWKIEGNITNLPDNVLISKWLPQQDLLGHPFCKLAILHGGLMSLQEAIYHGVPVLGFPLGVDRDGNLAKAVQMGFAKSLNWRTITEDLVFETISELITNPCYREQAQKCSSVSRDNLRSPRETGAFWVEYVVRHKGAFYMKSDISNLNILQYLLLDIIGTIVIIIAICVGVSCITLKHCYKCYKRSQNVYKTNKLKLS